MEALREGTTGSCERRSELGCAISCVMSPELAFYVDDSLEYIEAIDKLLK